MGCGQVSASNENDRLGEGGLRAGGCQLCGHVLARQRYARVL